jgi:hypothetical protein
MQGVPAGAALLYLQAGNPVAADQGGKLMPIPCDDCTTSKECSYMQCCRESLQHDANGNRTVRRDGTVTGDYTPGCTCCHCTAAEAATLQVAALTADNEALRANARASLWGIMGGTLAVIVVVALLILRSHGS